MSATESRAATNLAVLGGIYEASGRGDIDSLGPGRRRLRMGVVAR
jgi:hypothetical protein